MKTEVIDLVSDSESEEATVTPRTAAYKALQDFLPRKVKPVSNLNGSPKPGAPVGLVQNVSALEDAGSTFKQEHTYTQIKRREDKAVDRSISANHKSAQVTAATQDADIEARTQRFNTFHAKEAARRSSIGRTEPAAGSASQAGLPLTPQSPSSRPGTPRGRVLHSGPRIAIVEDLTSSDDGKAKSSTAPVQRKQGRVDATNVRPFKRQKTGGTTPAVQDQAQPRPNVVAPRNVQPHVAGFHNPPVQPVARPVQSSSGAAFLPEHDRLLAQLREVDNLTWDQILPYFPGRTRGSLQTRFCTRVKGKGLARDASQPAMQQTQSLPRPQPQQTPQRCIALPVRSPVASQTKDCSIMQTQPQRPSLPPQYDPPEPPRVHAQPRMASSSHTGTQMSSRATPNVASSSIDASPAGGHRARFTPEEDSLLVRLKEVENMSWREVAEFFPGRSEGALGVRYSTKIKNRGILPSTGPLPPRQAVQLQQPVTQPRTQRQSSQEEAESRRPVRQRRTGGAAAMDGFVSWSEIVKNKTYGLEPEHGTEPREIAPETALVSSKPKDDRHQNNKTKLLWQRQLGYQSRRCQTRNGIPDELKKQTLDGYRPRSHYESTCGDVTCLTWAADSRRFAASSIAVSDDRSMQYNSGLNLLLGDAVESKLQELPEHHVPRPLVDSRDNPNALHAMRESQDPRLFLTVAAAAFSPHGQRLYSAGSDRKLRMYRIGSDVTKARCRYQIDQPASVDLLSISKDGFVASGSHSPVESIRIYDCQPTTWSLRLCFSPSSADSRSAQALYPSSLKWGIAHHHRNFLLAGFSSDSNDQDTVGETALWDAESGHRWDLSTVTRNVFDVAWNPAPSSTSTAFAVASTPGAVKSSRNTRSVIQCYAPSQNRGREVLQWECPARDINDLTYCPHDDNLIAAGATDGRVYIWDQRFARRHQRPLHIFSHGESLNVLDHDRDRELADTGVRFLSWGATGSRLYTGSSDGVVKVWDPYSSPGDALVKDVATFQTAIMSGAFNHDFHELLIGEECGRINLLSLGQDDEDGSARPSAKFKLLKATAPQKTEAPPFAAARELLDTKQIVLRPMGSMPIRQAVQGPDYKGPYVKPSADDWNRVQDDLDEAATAQDAAHRRMDIDVDDDDLDKPEAADARVKAAQDAWTHLQAQHDDADRLERAAAETQKAFQEAEVDMEKLEITYGRDKCTLGCGYLPKDDVGGHADTRESEQRIPGALQALARNSVGLQDMTCKDLFEAGLASKCTHCTAKISSRMMKEHFKNMCRQRVASIKATFNGQCSSCSAPIRREQGLCASCSFPCFRCSQPVKVLQNDDSIQSVILCEQCELVWERGVLGHELVREQSPEPINGWKGVDQMDVLRLKSWIKDDSEMEYHNSKWDV